MTLSKAREHRRLGPRAAVASLFLFVASVPWATPSVAAVAAWTVTPGPATAAREGERFVLANEAVASAWTVKEGHLRAAEARNLLAKADLPRAREVFALIFRDGRVAAASSLTIVSGPEEQEIAAVPGAVRGADGFAAKAFLIRLRDPLSGAEVDWRPILENEAHYIRQTLRISHAADLTSVQLVRVQASAGAHVEGMVPGSPLVTGDEFLGIEHPMSKCEVKDDEATCTLKFTGPVPATGVEVASVMGVAPPGQLRRGVLAYCERERAHPYRQFLHYNSWYDIGYFSKYDEAAALNVVDAFGQELVRKRGVRLDSFLFDDGWDDPKTLWGFHSGFPHGFTAVHERAASYGAAPGVWLSPWGGYGQPKKDRLAYAAAQGFETNSEGLAMSGPVYFARFRDVCLRMIREEGVNQLKLDGLGRDTPAVAGSRFGGDFEAAIALLADLRAAKPDLFINLTTGTWPSPFWLRYADSIWRGGEDHDFAGVGSDRQRWITYRDADTYAGIVRQGPLFPINSLMLHGLVFARSARSLSDGSTADFADEVWSYFGSGTDLQEMYITPSLLTKDQWDVLANAAKWARALEPVLVDTHWVGGDPAKLEVYGWAAWSPDTATLVVRNPSARPQSLQIDPAAVFELPSGAAQRWAATPVFNASSNSRPLSLTAGTIEPLHLEPFEVRVWILKPIH
jgi:hypothetical protein